MYLGRRTGRYSGKSIFLFSPPLSLRSVKKLQIIQGKQKINKRYLNAIDQEKFKKCVIELDLLTLFESTDLDKM